MKIREARVADVDAIWALETQLFPSDAWSREMLREELTGEHRRYLVLVDDTDTVQGYAGLLVVGDDGDIQTIGVAAEARGMGHGRALMEALLAEAERRGASQVFLEVRADNPAARHLYAALGFREIGVRPRYYQPEGVDALVMRVRLHERQRVTP